MEILKQPAGFYRDQSNGTQSVADIAQTITAGQQHYIAVGDKAVTEKLWKKKQPGLEGEAGPNGVAGRPLEETGTPRDGPPSLRQVTLQGRPGRAGQRDALAWSETTVANHRAKAVNSRDAVVKVRDVLAPADIRDKAGSSDKAGMSKGISGVDKAAESLTGADGAEKGMANEPMPAGMMSQGRLASEFMQMKAPEQPTHERQHTLHSSSAELKQHTAEQNSVLTYTFNKARANRESAIANSVQISFKGATVMTPSNRNTYDNLMAHNSQDHDYQILPDPEQRQHRQQRDDQSEDER